MKPILITGCARSRTSLTAGIIHLCGAWGGNLASGNRWNQKGVFENKEIKRLIKNYLQEIGMDPLGQNLLPKTEELKPDPKWRDKVLAIMHGDIWFIKEAKICLMWPVWADAFPETKWIVVRRKPYDIVQSCLRCDGMHAYKAEAGWFQWVETHQEKFIEMYAAGLDYREVWPEKIINGNLKEMKNIINWLGLAWNEKAIDDFIEPALTAIWKQK
jgi:hypothetical protein